ncbi:MAG: tyrosine-type recombinase/integrase [Actinobacteria bacterium]|nr:tyrosine-type recombinase/integrase [Actinomycetota bacterium]
MSPESGQDHILSVLKQALNIAVAWEKVPRNVAQQVTAPPLKKRQINPLTPDEARQFLAACENDRLGALFTVALTMGLRRGEILGLQWCDVNFESRALSVRHAYPAPLRIEATLKTWSYETRRWQTCRSRSPRTSNVGRRKEERPWSLAS